MPENILFVNLSYFLCIYFLCIEKQQVDQMNILRLYYYRFILKTLAKVLWGWRKTFFVIRSKYNHYYKLHEKDILHVGQWLYMHCATNLFWLSWWCSGKSLCPLGAWRCRRRANSSILVDDITVFLHFKAALILLADPCFSKVFDFYIKRKDTKGLRFFLFTTLF